MLKPNVGSLLDAIAAGDDAKIQYCLDNGVSCNGGSNFANTPMHYAAFHGRAMDVHRLAEVGANIDALNEMKRTPLHTAAQQLKLETLAALIGLGARLDSVDVGGKTPKDLALERKLPESAAIVALLDAAQARQMLAKVIALAATREGSLSLSSPT